MTNEATGQRRWLRGVVRGGLLAGVLALSFATENVKGRLHTRGHWHFPGHVVVFYMVELLVVAGIRRVRTSVLASVLVTAAGCAIEWGQHLVYGQPLETLDMWADGLGVMMGLAVWLFWRERRLAARQRRG